ncbi:[protein-PII] uridylyltransferase [Mangrovactinospora gilvigrisea]|uniref:Bifunctional uridylyltransferase/uridylyl-removing enzyme n=1 Tax=Mangrovactinospora gilvigrisea TaxID=1428644 RepID=A0A1J7BTD7_9ACTN|nr:[protein-PII] uridylyltransferase [Mangrovactinospora gilvigrisea]OIV36721.1 [protein-PII] uridylyltransferase [Mangrovactinospora gilvigrisea]
MTPDGFREARAQLLKQGLPAERERLSLTALTDGWLQSLFEGPGALAAVGGYGRRELSPYSDLDVVLLLPKGAAPDAERLWYPIWDAGLALDHSVRTPAEAAALAGEDIKVALGLLDVRHLAGDPALTESVRTRVLADWRADAPRRLPELRDLGRERAARHGELMYLLEPDLKEARGGLRDLTALRAVAASWTADAPHDGLREAAAVLHDTRRALHRATDRATDRLARADRDGVAAELGLLDGETLLRRVYEAGRTVAYAADVTWREVGRVLDTRRGGRAGRAGRHSLGLRRRRGGPVPHPGQPLAEGVAEQDGEAVLAAGVRPERDPVLPLRAAAAAAQAGLPLSPHAAARLADCPPLPVPWPDEAREALLALLGAGPDALQVWEALEARRLVSRMLPDWERVRCRPHSSPLHRWTVDRHLLETAAHAAARTRRVHRPDLLLAAALLHDMGRGWPGDHAVAGETIARDMAGRMGFGKEDADVLARLVRHHLLLLTTGSRRDPEDPATLAPVVEAVGDAGTLELLHVLTEADALATGPEVWTDWRAQQVDALVERVGAVLAGDAPPPPAETVGAEEERLAVEAARTGEPVLTVRPGSEGAPSAEILLAGPDTDGFAAIAAGVLALHRVAVRAAAADVIDPLGQGPVAVLAWTVAADRGTLPAAARLRQDLVRALGGGLKLESRLAKRDEAARTPRPGFPEPRAVAVPGASATATVLEVRAHDGPGLLHRIGLALGAAGVRIQRARVSTFGADAVDTFYVLDPDGAPLSPEAAKAAAATVERELRGAPGARGGRGEPRESRTRA